MGCFAIFSLTNSKKHPITNFFILASMARSRLRSQIMWVTSDYSSYAVQSVMKEQPKGEPRNAPFRMLKGDSRRHDKMKTTTFILTFAVALLGGCSTSPQRSELIIARERYESIILPEATFNEVELSDVINFLRCASVDYYPEDPRGMNIAVGHGLGHFPSKRKITLRCKNRSLLWILEAACEQAGVELAIEPCAAIHLRKDMLPESHENK